MRANRLVSLAILSLLSVAAGKATDVVHQKGRTFSVDAVAVARGQQVVFLNDDTVPHNIMSTSPGNAFNLGAQSPGSSTPVSFDRTGIVAVICAIHPRMQMTITVSD